jgi:GNAT superfamily N-acetyltransferase
MFCIERITQESTYLKEYFLQTRVKQNLRPTIDDVECFLALDTTALYAGMLDGKPIGVLAVFKHENGYRHVGALYIEDKYRKCGYGSQLSLGAFKMSEPIENVCLYTLPLPYKVEMYKKCYGVHEILYSVEAHVLNSATALRKLQGISMDATYHVKQILDVDFEAVFDYDKLTFGYDRKQFLYKWLFSSASRSCVALNNEGSVVGYVVAREWLVSDECYTIGPLFCEGIDVGKVLIRAVLQQINEQCRSTSISVRMPCPVGRNPQVHNLLNSLNSNYITTFACMSRNGDLKGCVDKWFAVTSLVCG